MKTKILPKVSVVITTHNRLSLLKRAVRSVRLQDYDNIEIIVVDDASEDGTKEWCINQDFRYIYIAKVDSCGGNYARNQGINSSTGKYVAFLDDDDYWLPSKIRHQVAKLEETGNEVVHCNRKFEIIHSDGSVTYEPYYMSELYRGDLSKRILYQITVLTSALLVQRSALLEVGGFDEKCKYWQEYELSIRLAQRKPFDLIEDVELVYRIDKEDVQRLTNKYEGWKQSVEYIYKKHRTLYKTLNPLNKIRVKLLYLLDSSLRAKDAGLNGLAKRQAFVERYLNLIFRVYDKCKIKFIKR